MTRSTSQRNVVAAGGAFLLLFAPVEITQAEPRPTMGESPAATPGDDAPKLELLMSRVQQSLQAGNLPDAIAGQQQIVALVRESPGNTDEKLAEMLDVLAALEELRAGFPAARQARQEAREILLRLHGPTHWKVAEARWALEDIERLEKMNESDRESLREANRLSRQAAEQLRQNKRSDALFSVLQVVGIRARLLGVKHPQFADSICLGAATHASLGETSKAAALYENAVRIYCESLGPSHPRCVKAQSQLADLRRGAAGATGQTKPPPEVAAPSRLGKDDGHLPAEFAPPRSSPQPGTEGRGVDGRKVTPEQVARLAAILPQLARMESLLNQGKFEEVTKLAEQVRTAAREVFGPQHPAYVRAVEALAKAQDASGDLAAARATCQELLQLHAQQHGPEHWKVKEARWTLADLDRRAKLAPVMSDARLLGEARFLHGTALGLFAQGRYSAALETATKALAVLEQTQATAHPLYVGTLADLAVILARLGEGARAIELGRQAVTLAERHLGREHPICARALGNLGGFLVERGEYSGGEPLCREFTEITQRTLGADHPQYAVGLSRLADLYQSLGDYPRAETLLREAVAVSRTNFADDPLACARRLGNLAGLYVRMGEHPRAEPLYLEALAIIRERLGEQHHEYAVAASSLGIFYRETGEAAKAATIFERVRDLVRRTLGESHPSYRQAVIHLAETQALLGKYQEAEEVFREELERLERSPQDDPGAYISAHSRLGGLFFATGKYAEAEACFRLVLEHAERSLGLASLIQSERQQFAMLASMRASLDIYLSAAPRAGVADDDIYQLALPWKGAILARQRRLRPLANDPQCAALLADLRGTARRLASLALATPGRESLDAWRREMTELTERRERQEEELSRQLAAAEPSDTHHAASAWSRLSADGVLIDCLEFTHFEPPASRQGPFQTTRRCLVFIVRPGRPTVRVDLGPMEPIEQAVEAWREENVPADGSRGLDVRTRTLPPRPPSQPGPAATLRRLLWEPLEEHLHEVRAVFVSPDKALAQFPWGALPGKTPGSYLIEDYAIAVIPVPHSFPELLDARELTAGSADHEPSLLLVGDVDFGTAPDAASRETIPPPGTKTEGPVGGRRTDPRTLPGRGRIQWSPLLGTTEEIKRLEQIWRETHPGRPVQTLRGSTATEEAVRRLAPQSCYLHLATHGFFATREVQSALDMAAREGGSRAWTAPEFGLFAREGLVGWHPGLLSGLVLAGANRGSAAAATDSSPTDDGVLTALEASTLDLRAVELVVLSACETGLGRQAGGEGLLGLQRAFQVAGAQTVVASLWKVSDQSTQRLISQFYENLWHKKLSKVEALQQAQLAILRDGKGPSSGHRQVPDEAAGTTSPKAAPRLWAAWVLSGDPGDPRFWVRTDRELPSVASAADAAEAQAPESPLRTSYLRWAFISLLVLLGGGGALVFRFLRRKASYEK